VGRWKHDDQVNYFYFFAAMMAQYHYELPVPARTGQA